MEELMENLSANAVMNIVLAFWAIVCIIVSYFLVRMEK